MKLEEILKGDGRIEDAYAARFELSAKRYELNASIRRLDAELLRAGITTDVCW